MSLPSFASLEEFEARYQSSVPAADETRVETLLSDASTLVREAAGDDYVDDVGVIETFPDVFVIVCCEAARRAYDNPQGLTSETVGNYAWRGLAVGSVYLTAAEQRMIRKAAGKLGVGTVELEGFMPVVDEDDPLISEWPILSEEDTE